MGVQGHQKSLENTELLKKMDVFVCLVAQEPGVPGGLRPPRTPPPKKVRLAGGGVPLTSGRAIELT